MKHCLRPDRFSLRLKSRKEKERIMRVWKLVAGIISILLFVVVMFQSCAAGFINAVESNGGSSGSFGVFFAFLILAGGIVSIASRNSEGKGGNIAIIVIFGLATIVAFGGHGNYADLIIWGVWTLINAVVAIIALIRSR